jgi:succinate dehydrogenase / fumarate reductase flavoprotein subunit
MNHLNWEDIPVIPLNTAVVGFGAAALNAADRLFDLGQKDIALVCENTGLSTSRNTGSDKQTYYKLSLSGEDGDSVRALARTLYGGKCVDGDIALCEAALSAQCFFRLKELGVPFPVNRWGEYIGYKTDHDPKRRATSAGPLTSKLMVECLEKSVRKKGIKVYDGMLAISIITKDDKCAGLLCLDLSRKDEAGYVLFNCANVVWATGGPAGMYADSVYPHGQTGSTGIAFEAGAAGKNLTEWQFGIASLHPRWNVSGTYVQALPRMISREKDGSGETEFLSGFFKDKKELFSNVFLKGYQWPFDVRKASGSSMIDILVYIETNIKGRRVFLDFTRNPEDLSFDGLCPEALDYLKKAGALFGIPVERLIHMNAPAYEFYLSRGIDLKREPLEIALCAQHNNGGLSTDCWWQTDVKGLFAAGEVCGSHGVCRPGGSALNAGQAGSLRAAQYIARNRKQLPMDNGVFLKIAAEQAVHLISMAENAMGAESNIDELWGSAGRRMSRAGGPVRNLKDILRATEDVKNEIADFEKNVRISGVSEVKKLFQLRDTLIAQHMYLSAMADYLKNGGRSRGSALYFDPAGQKTHEMLDDALRFTAEGPEENPMIQEARLKDGECRFIWRTAREIPPEDGFFENVWKTYIENGNVY